MLLGNSYSPTFLDPACIDIAKHLNVGKYNKVGPFAGGPCGAISRVEDNGGGEACGHNSGPLNAFNWRHFESLNVAKLNVMKWIFLISQEPPSGAASGGP